MRLFGMPRKSVWTAALIAFLMGGFLHVPRANAQSSPLSFQECLDKQKELRDEAKSFGDRAWAAVRALQGLKFFSEELNALYKKGEELGAAADALHCVSDLGRAATDADKLKKIEDIGQFLIGKAVLNPAISDYVNDQFEAIDKDKQSALDVLGKTEIAIRDSPALGVEGVSDTNSLGNSQTLGNSQALGKYSTMVEVDIKAAEEAGKQAEAEREDAVKKSQPAAAPGASVNQQPTSKARSEAYAYSDSANSKSCDKLPKASDRLICDVFCMSKAHADQCRYIIKEIIPRKLYDARQEGSALHCYGQRGNIADGFRECRAQCERLYNSGFCYNKCYESDTTSESGGRSCFRGP